MNFAYTGGTTYQRALVTRTIELVKANGYPLDGLEMEVEVTWPEEPSFPGHSEFAAANLDGAAGSIEIRNALDSWDNDPYTGEDFYMEVVAHEIGHLASFFVLNTQAKRDAMAGLFRRVELDRPETSGYPVYGTPGQWDSGDWADRVQEGVAEAFKDVWLTPDQRKFDNRTNWELPQGNFREFLELMGITGANGGGAGGGGGTPTLVTRSAPLIGGIGPQGFPNRGYVFGDGPGTPLFWSFSTGNQFGGSAYDFTSEFPGGTVIQDHTTLPLDVTTLHVELDLSMVPDFASSDVALAQDYYGNLAGVDYVGWGPGDWQNWRFNNQFAAFEQAQGELWFRLAWWQVGSVIDEIMLVNLVLNPGTPMFSGDVTVPLERGAPATLTFDMFGSSPGPLGPGVPQNWATRSWTASYTIEGEDPPPVDPLPEHLLPDFPYTGEGSGTFTPDGPSTVRRGGSGRRRRRRA